MLHRGGSRQRGEVGRCCRPALVDEHATHRRRHQRDDEDEAGERDRRGDGEPALAAPGGRAHSGSLTATVSASTVSPGKKVNSPPGPATSAVAVTRTRSTERATEMVAPAGATFAP